MKRLAELLIANPTYKLVFKAGFFCIVFTLTTLIMSRLAVPIKDGATRLYLASRRRVALHSHGRLITDHVNFKPFEAFDRCYKYSRVFTKKGFLLDTSYKYFVFTCILSAVMLLLGWIIWSFFIGFVLFCGVWIVCYGFLEVKRLKNNRSVASNLEIFLNMLDNYSIGNDRLVSVLEKVSYKVHGTLRDCIEECVAESQGTRHDIALDNLSRKIENKKFCDIINAMKIAERYSGTFRLAVTSIRTDIADYQSEQKQLKAIVVQNGVFVLISLIAGLTMIYLGGTITGENGFKALLTTMFGKITLTVQAGAVLWFLKTLLNTAK